MRFFKKKISFRSDNLAVPEVQTGAVEQPDELEDDSKSEIVYDTLAVPEIKIHHTEEE